MDNPAQLFKFLFAILGILLALSYFSHRLYWSGKWMIASIKKEEDKASYALSKALNKTNWFLLAGAIFFVFLYKYLFDN